MEYLQAMRSYKIGKTTHHVYELDDEIPEHIHPIADWRECKKHDWVTADDGCVIQVLRYGSMKRSKGKVRTRNYIGTCTGTFEIRENAKMDTSRRVNIWAFGGNILPEERLKIRENCTPNEIVFVKKIMAGTPISKASLESFPTTNPGYAQVAGARLVATNRVGEEMKKELAPLMEKLGITDEFILQKYLEELSALDAKPADRLKVLDTFKKLRTMDDTAQVQTLQVGAAQFSGFLDSEIDTAASPNEIQEAVIEE